MSDIYTDINLDLIEWSRPQELPDVVLENANTFALNESKMEKRQAEEVPNPRAPESQVSLTEDPLFGVNDATLKDMGPLFPAITFCLLVSLCGYLLFKFKKSGKFLISNDTQKMKISQTLSLGPKRHLILLTLGDKEIVLGNHENGMSFLFDNSPAPQPQIITTRKSDIETAQEPLLSIADNAKNTPIGTMVPEQKSKFPKYLAQSFEKEKSKVDEKHDQMNDNVENITNMIRQKLRDMKKPN